MRTLTTNRFLTKMLRTLCCVGALTASWAWATVATLQLDNTGAVLHQSSGQSSVGSARTDEPFLFAASKTPTRPATELDESMARSFDEGFVSVPTVQFASTGAVAATGSGDVSMASMTSGPGLEPVPEMSALFPIVGLIAAVSCTQILRRRRAAQQSASRSVG